MATQREQKDKVHPFIENLFVTIFTAVSSLVVVKWNMRTKHLNKKISSRVFNGCSKGSLLTKAIRSESLQIDPSTQKLREIAWLLKVRGAYNLGKKILKESSTTLFNFKKLWKLGSLFQLKVKFIRKYAYDHFKNRRNRLEKSERNVFLKGFHIWRDTFWRTIEMRYVFWEPFEKMNFVWTYNFVAISQRFIFAFFCRIEKQM